MFSSHHELGIYYNVHGENDSSKRCVDSSHDFAWKDCTEDSKDHQAKQQGTQDSIAHGEIDL